MNNARAFVLFSNLSSSRFERNTRETREKGLLGNAKFRSAREKRSHHRLVGPPKTRFVCGLFSTFQSPKEARR